MKRLVLIVSILVLAPTLTLAQQPFYYFKNEDVNKKIPLQAAEDWKVVRVPVSARAPFERIVSRHPNVRLKQALTSDRGFYWLTSKSQQKLSPSVIEQIGREVSIQQTISAYPLAAQGDTTHFLITDEFRVEFVSGVSRSEIRQINQKHGIQFAPVSDYEKTLA